MGQNTATNYMINKVFGNLSLATFANNALDDSVAKKWTAVLCFVQFLSGKGMP